MYELNLGCAPTDVEPAQVGEPDYHAQARRECHAYAGQLQRVYKAEFGKDFPAPIRVKSNPHDFGFYYSVEAGVSDKDIEAAEWLEEHEPQYWDSEAEQDLAERDMPTSPLKSQMERMGL